MDPILKEKLFFYDHHEVFQNTEHMTSAKNIDSIGPLCYIIDFLTYSSIYTHIETLHPLIGRGVCHGPFKIFVPPIVK